MNVLTNSLEFPVARVAATARDEIAAWPGVDSTDSPPDVGSLSEVYRDSIPRRFVTPGSRSWFEYRATENAGFREVMG